MLKSLLPKLKCSNILLRSCSSASTNVNDAVLKPRELLFPPKYDKPRQIWLENLDTIEEIKLGILDLHPDVFGTYPRIDVIQQNIRWQRNYRFVSYAHTKVRSEVRGGGKKPWPQKGIVNNEINLQ